MSEVAGERPSSLQVRLKISLSMSSIHDLRMFDVHLQRDRVSRVRKAGMIVLCRYGR